MIKKFGLVILGGILLLGGLSVRAQETTEKEAAVKLGSGATLKNTIIWGNKGKQVGEGGPTAVNCYIQQEGVASPQFVDSVNFDFRLKNTSPCIDGGTNDVLGTFFTGEALDLWGNKRFIETVDIGAHEYTFYRVYFELPSKVVIQSVKDTDACDTNHVEPGHTYRFKIDFSQIAGITADMVTVKMLTGDTEIRPDENAVYEIADINSDVYVKVTVTPPVVVSVEVPEHGQLKITGGAKTIPLQEGEKLTTSLVVEENASVSLDTVSDAGYYCRDVFVWETGKGAASRTSVKDKVGTGKQYQVGKKDVTFTAEFVPYSYPVQLRVNDRTMGELKVTNNKNAESWDLPAGSVTKSYTCAYDPALELTITVTPATGYAVKSVKVYDKDGKNPVDLTEAETRKTAMQVGGLTVEAVFEPKICTVSWKCEHGELTVNYGTPVKDPATGLYSLDVPYNTTLTITLTGEEGYEYQAGTLKATVNGVQSAVPDATKQWTVQDNTSLSAVFVLKKYLIAVTSNLAGVTDFYTVTPVLPADHKVEHGTSLTFYPKDIEGYNCKEIRENGTVTGSTASLAISSVTEEKTIQFVFEKKTYQVEYNTPANGTLTVKSGSTATGPWTALGVSPASVSYGDYLQIQTGADAHYKLTSLKTERLTAGTASEKTSDGTYTEGPVKENIRITAAFEPEKYTVVLEKATTGDPQRGKLVLKDGTGHIWGTVEKSATAPVTVTDIPYNTRLWVSVENTDEGYGPTAADTTAGGAAGSIKDAMNFLVTQDVTVTVEIGAVSTMYTVDWEIDQPDGSRNDLRVTEADGTTPITKNGSYVSGKQLLLTAASEARDTFQYVVDQKGNKSSDWKTAYTLTGDVVFTAKFVRKCTVRIDAVGHATLEVWKDGAQLADGTVVPAGSVLTVKMKADVEAGCDEITADGTQLWARPQPATTAPVATREESYTIATDHTGGEIWFRGKASEYYKVRFAAASFGTLSVTVAGTALSAATDYWYAAGVSVGIRAEETSSGYCFNSDRKVENKAAGASGDIVLTASSAGVYTEDLTLSEDLDLAATFVRKKYPVHIVVSPAGTTLAGVGATLSVTGGTPALSDFGTTEVEHGGTLQIAAGVGAGYIVRILREDNSVAGTSGSSAAYSTQQIVKERTYTVKFIKLYQVFYNTAEIEKVIRTDGTVLANGGYAYEGESLKAVSKQQTGKKCTEVKVEGNVAPFTSYASSVDPLPNRTVECSFTMPAEDVKVKATFDWLKYDLAAALTGPDGSASLNVTRIDGLNEIPLTPGTGVLSYGDRLKIVLGLTPAVPGTGQTWYEVKAVKALMGTADVGFNTSVSGLNYVYEFTVTVTDHVNITAEVVRRMKNLILRVDPAGRDFSIELRIGGGASRFFSEGYQTLQVPVGASVQAWPRIGQNAPEGYELDCFPSAGKKEASLSATMPLDNDLALLARFTLKKFPLNIQVSPAAGGAISVADDQGRNYTSGKYSVEYGTALTAITVAATDAYYHFDRITGYMGGTDRLQGQTSPYHIDKVVDSVGIEAVFSRRYRILKNTVEHGTLSVTEVTAAADATGNYYPEGTRFAVQVAPQDNSYECTGVTLLFPGTALSPVSLTLDGDGKAAYTIPAGLTAKDITFSALFGKKKYNVVLKRVPPQGGSAEVWLGEKPSGTLLAQLPEGNMGTEITVQEVEHGSSLTLYAAPKVPDWEVAARTLGANVPYTGPVTLESDTVFTVRFGRLYVLTFGPNITVKKAGENTFLTSGVRIPEGMELIVRAELTGHDCTSLVADSTGDGGQTGTYRSWTDQDADGVIEERFSMAGGDVDIRASFQPKRFKIKIIQQPSPLAFDVLDVTVTPKTAGNPPFVVDTVQGSLAEYLSGLELTDLTLHPWFEGPVSVTAVMKGDPTVYDLQANGLTVKDSVVITAVAHRKQKTLTVQIQTENGAVGNQVIVQTEDGQEHVFTEDAVLTVDVGAPLKIRTVEGEGCRTSLLVMTPPGDNPVTVPPFELNVEHMPDRNITVTAGFVLKRYPVYFSANTGGTVTVTKKFGGISEGVLTVSGEEVKHFTELEIVTAPLGPAYRLKNLKTTMGGMTVSDPAKIASVTASVNIEAEFERIYEVRKTDPDPAKGSLTVSRADTNAVGHRYPAATTVVVEALPRTGYEVTSLTMNGEIQPMVPEGGRLVCTLPGTDLTVDSVEFEVQYALKKYDVVFIASGEGVMQVDGLAGGTLRVEKTNKSRWVEHFTRLTLSVTPRSDAYRVARFNIHPGGGEVIPVTAADTTIEITGDVDIEVEFLKYYWVVYDGTPEHGKLVVSESDTAVRSGARYPGKTVLDIKALPDEGYEAVAGYPRWNEGEVANNTVILPVEDALYDTVKIETRFKIRQCRLAVTQPDSGYIRVERLDENNNWVNLDVTRPVELDYWTQIRMTTGVYNPAGYKVQDLLVNGKPYGEKEVWTIRGDCEVTALVVPRLYTVTYTEPAFGRLRVETPEGELASGTEVAYRTQLVVTAVPDDPEGYEVREVRINGQAVDNGTRWTVLENTEISAVISIRQWEVTTSVTGEGSLMLLRNDGSAIQSPSDIVDHYTVLRIKPVADPAWKLYSLKVYGAEMQSDSTVMVTRDVEVEAVFRKRETYLFPVAFTPNGDGYNDAWEISGLWQASENTLEIFNRDQQSLYKAAPYRNEWEGTTDNGKILPAGTYVYKFTAGPGEVYMGLVSIIRN